MNLKQYFCQPTLIYMLGMGIQNDKFSGSGFFHLSIFFLHWKFKKPGRKPEDLNGL